MLLSIILFSGILGIVNIKNLDISILQIEDLYVNRYSKIKILAKNNYKGLFLFLLKLEFEDLEVSVDSLENSSISEHFSKIVFKKRGFNYLEGIYVTSIYPFNFFIRRKFYELNKEFLVYPEPKEPSEEFLQNIDNNKSDEPFKNHIFAHEAIDISGLRKYIKGDPVKNITWKHFFRNERLLVKKYEGTSLKFVIVEIKDDHDIEKILSFATYIIVDCWKRNIPVGVKINDTFFRPSTGLVHRNILLKNLALYNENNFTS